MPLLVTIDAGRIGSTRSTDEAKGGRVSAISFDSGSSTVRGIAWMVVSGLLFVFVTGIVRHLGSDIPAVEAAFIRYAFGLVLLGPVLIRVLRARPKAAMVGFHAVRGFVHGFGVILWFYSMARIPIADVTAIGYTAPIFVTIGAAIFLGETLHLRRIAGVVIGFAGTLVIVRPGFETVSSGQLAQLAAAPLFAASYIIAKKMTAREDPLVIVGMLSLFVTLTLLPGALLSWRQPTLEEALLLGLTACFATAGHYALTRALRAAPITVTQPIGFLQLVWATIVGVTVFGEPVDVWVVAGGAIIVAAATYISHREAVAARVAVTPPATATKV
jgi:drug/metabolite transporter (DMT)-like permease